jgi:hypothetical protein
VGGQIEVAPPVFELPYFVGPTYPSVAWNPATDEFGVSYSHRIIAPGIGGRTWGATSFARVAASGSVVSNGMVSNTGSNNTYATDVDVNTFSGRYAVAWWEGGATAPRIKVAEIDQNGNPLPTTPFTGDQYLVSYVLAGDRESVNISFNPFWGTFLLTGLDANGSLEVVSAELDGHGVMFGTERAVTDLDGAAAYFPRAAPQANHYRWTIAFSRYAYAVMDQIVSSSSGPDVNRYTQSTGPASGLMQAPLASRAIVTAPTRGTDIAFDPVDQVYLLVGADGPLNAGFIDADGRTLGSPFAIAGGAGATAAVMPRVEYSVDVNGGSGGFLVNRHHQDAGHYVVHARVVAYPAGPIGVEGVIGDAGPPGAGGFAGTGAAVAYSMTSKQFYVVWQQQDVWRVLGRAVGLDAQPLGATAVLAASGNARYPGVAWNSVADDFAVSYSADIIPPGGSTYDWSGVFVLTLNDTTNSCGSTATRVYNAGSDRTQATDIDFNPFTQSYVVAWFEQGFDWPSQIRAAEVGRCGTPVTSTSPSSTQFLVSRRLAGNRDAVSIAFNRLARAFLVVGLDAQGSGDVLGLALDAHASALSAERPVTSLFGGTASFPRTASSGNAGVWGLSFSRDSSILMSRIVSMNLPAALPAAIGAVRGDFTGDGRTDLIWQDPATGAVVLWAMSGPAYLESVVLNAGGTVWQIAGAGDFTGDSKTDLIWQHPQTGGVLLWQINGTGYVSSTLLNSGGTYWKVVGVGDFTGDGKPDLLWQHPQTGAVLLWIMNGPMYVDSVMLNTGGTYWQVVGTADFNGDGKTDVVWQEPSSGAVLMWTMNGTTYVSSMLLSTGATAWRIAAVGDYTGDGKSDLIWQLPSSGAVLLWAMDGPTYVNSTMLDTGDTTWRIRGPR